MCLVVKKYDCSLRCVTYPSYFDCRKKNIALFFRDKAVFGYKEMFKTVLVRRLGTTDSQMEFIKSTTSTRARDIQRKAGLHDINILHSKHSLGWKSIVVYLFG